MTTRRCVCTSHSRRCVHAQTHVSSSSCPTRTHRTWRCVAYTRRHTKRSGSESVSDAMRAVSYTNH
jgi:hypothetical protein